MEKELKKEGKSRFDLGREAFEARVWEWKEKYGDIILSQLKSLGASCDWSRTRFTMDPEYAAEVAKAFIHYHEKGLLYRAFRTVNWCTRCATGISDLEVEYKEEPAVLYYLQYGPFVVATSRPETRFGDTALAVHPNDARYAEYIGKEVEIETLDVLGDVAEPKKVKMMMRVVGDEVVDPAFGTGVIKVTPAHDMTDFEIGKRHGLEVVQVIGERGKLCGVAGKYSGMKVKDARVKVVEDMRALGLITKEEPYTHNLAVCSRCATVIEPLPSKQWFMKMKGLAEDTHTATVTGAVRIVPEQFTKGYLAWLEGIRDWCVSRQLWWGHRLPVYFCSKNEQESVNPKSDTDDYIVSLEKPAACPYCKECVMRQSDDVLDTWFSSALWPYAGLSKEDVRKFYPSSVLVTARDIINLWVGRMVFSGLEFRAVVPFKDVLIHATVLTKDGKRMSKSLGTGVDPISLIEKYGADATRFGIAWQAMGGQDMRWDEAAVIAGKKFANKIWNASRFVFGRIDESSVALAKDGRASFDLSKLLPHDAEILVKLTQVKTATEKAIGEYEFGQAIRALYGFFWNDFCDVYVEAVKAEKGSETDAVLLHVLRESLVLLHPFMPFVTERLWREIPESSGTLLMAGVRS